MSEEKRTDDPCHAESTYSGSRAFAFTLIFIAMFAFTFLAIPGESLLQILLGSAISCTTAVMLYGFARKRNGTRSFLFICPVVVTQYPRLLKPHAAIVDNPVQI
jgi:hypothetical protein